MLTANGLWLKNALVKSKRLLGQKKLLSTTLLEPSDVTRRRRKPPKGVVMEPTRIELLEAWITIQKLLQTDPKLDEYHKQILPDVLSLLNHRQDKLKGRE